MGANWNAIFYRLRFGRSPGNSASDSKLDVSSASRAFCHAFK